MEETPSTTQTTEQQPQQNPQPPPAAAAAAATATATTVAAATSSSSLLPPATTNVSSPNLNPAKPSTTPQPQQSTTSQARPAFNTRPWQQPSSPYSHFSLPPPPLLSSSSASTSSITAPPPPRGGMAGAPVLHPSTPPPPPASFSSLTPPSYAQQSQIRQPVQGMQGIGMTGTLGTTSSLRPGGVSPHPLRPSQSSHRPQASPNSQSPASQNFQGHSMLRVSSMGSPGSPSPISSQNAHPQNQPWLSSGTQGKPPLPSTSTRPQASPQSFQQRPHIPQQHQQNTPVTSQKQAISSGQQVSQPSSSGQQQEHHVQQFPPSRMQQPSSHQQLITRGPGLGSQRPPVGMMQSGPLQPGALNKTATAETEESSTRVLSKRSIQELVNQIDPSEKLDPDVEDILVDIAEDFVESITTFACSLAKHRKSTTLEAKDILLHLERNCNMTLPGFGGDEIKTYKKPFVSDIHRERLAAIKKSIVATDVATKHPGAQAGGNAKGHMAKGPANIIGSPPKPKLRETA